MLQEINPLDILKNYFNEVLTHCLASIISEQHNIQKHGHTPIYP
jgi:hypothetical protein